jgi:hypothetical protein
MALGVAIVLGEAHKELRVHPAWLAVIALGLVLVVTGFTKLRSLYGVASWPRTTGVIVSSTIKERKVTGRSVWTQYSPDIAFSYTVTGEKHTSNKFSIDSGSYWYNKREEASALKDRFVDGATVEIQVSPTNPGIAVLSAAIDPRRRSHYFAVLIGGSLLLAVDCVGIYWALN